MIKDIITHFTHRWARGSPAATPWCGPFPEPAIGPRPRDFNVYIVDPENRGEIQDALDSDIDNEFKVRSGHALVRDDVGRIWLHSNGSNGYAAGGTTVYAQIV